MAKPARKHRAAADWATLIEGQAASGLAQRDFCKNEGLAVSTFAYWKRKLRDVSDVNYFGRSATIILSGR